jgi:hypothetical protein
MTDLISRKDAIEAVEGLFRIYSCNPDHVDTAAVVEALSALPGVGWRDIASDPPPHGEYVLLCWYHGHWETWEYEAQAYSHGIRHDDGHSSVSYHGSATHWMPLPEPPE